MGRPLNLIVGRGSVPDLARDIREKLTHGISNKEVARRTNLSEATVSRALAGAKLPSIHTVRALAAAFSSDPEQWEWRYELAQRGSYRYNLSPVLVMTAMEATHKRKAAPVPKPGTDREIDLDVFKVGLQAVRAWAGNPSLRTIERAARYQGHFVPRSTLCEMLDLSVARRPRFDLVMGYLRTLQVDESSLRAWRHAYGRLEDERQLKSSA
jgi:transcriptional regulator with XRE-family HTH domain